MSQIQQFENKSDILSPENGRSNQSFTNNLVNFVVIILVVAAYAPALIDVNFYASISKFIITILLGILYVFIGTYGMTRHEKIGTKTATISYFVIQISIVFIILGLGRGIDHSFWLMMLPLSAQALARGWTGAFLVSLIQIIGINLLFIENWTLSHGIQTSLSMASAMVFTVLFSQIAIRESSSRKEIERLATDLREANHRLATYATQVDELATVRERNRLAREIHDNLGHYLTVVNVQLEAARTIMPSNPAKAEEAINKAQGLTQDGLNAIRQSVSALRTSPLAERPLPEAITHLATETDTAGIATSVTVNGTARPLAPQIALTIYRTAQEGLTNIRKYACASHVNLILNYESSDEVIFTITDNGVGIDLSTNEIDEEPGSGFGLLGLRERVKLLNGTLTIDTSPGKGLSLQISIPT